MSEQEPTTFTRITNREVYDVVVQLRDDMGNVKNAIGNVLGENVELRKRVRGLELRFYGILAGLIGAVSVYVAGLGGGR